MDSTTSQDRLLPSLLDRLTDDSRHSESELRSQRVSTMVNLRAAVLRDLEHLLNTTNLEASTDLSNYPELRSTVINFGLPGMSGITLNAEDREHLMRVIKETIEAFEPRILKNTLKVHMILDQNNLSHSAIAFEIEGTLWGNPMPESLYLRTELDLELGNVSVVEL